MKIIVILIGNFVGELLVTSLVTTTLAKWSLLPPPFFGSCPRAIWKILVGSMLGALLNKLKYTVNTLYYYIVM